MKSTLHKTVQYIILTVIGLVMVYPLIWLFTASFKSNSEIFSGLSLIPSRVSLQAYVEGWKGSGQYGFGTFFLNSFSLVVPTVLFTIISSAVVGYGFARFKFPLKRVLFLVMISTLMLPDAVIIVPRYILFKNLGWLDSYEPFIIPSIFATNSFFIFMMVQFFRGIPKELDQAASIDGCNSFMTFIRILLPLSKPALFSVGIFQFIWTWNEFFNVFLYVSKVSKFTLALGLNMALDTQSIVNWNRIIAMSILSIIPPVLVFFFAQKYFVEGIATSGLKG
jgi:oligogalacturonide transport system permease protein